MLRWGLANAVRLALVFVVAATAYLVVVEPGDAVVAPFVAFVALVLFSPVLAVWLVVYLAAAQLASTVAPARLAAVVVAPLSWLALSAVDPEDVKWVALAAIAVFGVVAKPPPRSRRVAVWRARSTSSS